LPSICCASQGNFRQCCHATHPCHVQTNRIAVEKWREKPIANQTLPNFTAHFNFENKERLRKLTAQTADFHGAHQAAIAAAAAAAAAACDVIIDDLWMHCCHTHGLGKSAAHTSLTCTHPGANHKTEATITNMMGGNNKIYGGQP
jgi:hypothetical protein